MKNLKKGLRYHLYFLQITTSKRVNGFLYFLRQLPVIGKKIPVGIYKSYTIKLVLTIILTLTRLGSFLWKFLWLGLPVIEIFSLHHLTFSSQSIYYEQAVLLWFLMTVLFFSFITKWYYRLFPAEKDFVQQFQISRKIFVRTQAFVPILEHTIFYIPASLVMGLFAKNLGMSCFILLSYASLSFFFSYAGKLAFLRLSNELRLILFCSVEVLTLAVAAFLVFWKKGQYLGLLYSFPVLLFLLLLLVFSIWKLLCFKEDNAYLLKLYDLQTVDGEKQQNLKTARTFNVKMQDKMTVDDFDGSKAQFSDKTGSNYLNALLFYRYRKMLRKDFLLRFLPILAIGLVLCILAFIFHPEVGEAQFYSIMPVFFFYMYMLGFGKKTVQMVFLNCDSAMLYYPFYRTKEVILKGFLYRFRKILFYNGMIAGATYVFVLVLYLLLNSKANGFFFLIFFFVMLSLVLLYSFHDLFIYYLLQPFSSDLTIVNKLYNVIGAVFYGFSYINIQIHAAGLTYVLILAGSSLLYVAVGFAVIMKKAPQTFRIK